MKNIFLACLLFLLSAFPLLAQSPNQDWSESKADEWFKKKEYLSGLSATPHEAIDKVQFAQQYHLNKALWDKAFAF